MSSEFISDPYLKRRRDDDVPHIDRRASDDYGLLSYATRMNATGCGPETCDYNRMRYVHAKCIPFDVRPCNTVSARALTHSETLILYIELHPRCIAKHGTWKLHRRHRSRPVDACVSQPTAQSNRWHVHRSTQRESSAAHSFRRYCDLRARVRTGSTFWSTSTCPASRNATHIATDWSADRQPTTGPAGRPAGRTIDHNRLVNVWNYCKAT